MPRRLTSVAAAAFVLVLTFVAVPGSAQLVASRDLTSGWRVPSEHIAIPETCDKPRSSVINGDQAKARTVHRINLLLVAESDRFKPEDCVTGFVHRFDLLFVAARGRKRPDLVV